MSDIIVPLLSMVVVTNIILAAFIFSRGIKKSTNLLFGLIAATCALWGVAIIGFYSQPAAVLVEWLSFAHIFAICISYFFLIFSFIFPQKLFSINITAIIALIPILTILYLIVYTSYIVGEVSGLTYEIGEGYFFYIFIMISGFLGGYIGLINQYLKASTYTQKKQVKYILLGSILASSLAIGPSLIMPFLGIFSFTWLGPIFTFIMVVSIFLAIFKYRLFDVKVILTEIVSITIIVALIIELFFTDSVQELTLKTFVIVLISCFSYILIKGVYKEVKQREHIEKLASNLTTANTLLKELDKQKSEFVSFATHQLRAPLTAMKGYSSLILEGDMGKLEPPMKEAVTRIYDSSRTLANIVDDYLNISRIELGTMVYAFTVLDLRAMVKDVIAELKPNIEKTGLKFSFTAVPSGSNEHFDVSADRDKLKQVIGNLIDNALKYTPSGSIEVALTKNAEIRKIIFSVKDTGVGVAPEVMPKLFAKFVRANSANKQNIYGTGLGLYVVREIVTAHKGRVWVDSDGEGKGSTFYVELDTAI